MHIYLHIGLPHCGSARLQQVLDEKRARLAAGGVLFPRAPGRRNHTRLFMALSDPDHVDPLRRARGYAAPEQQTRLLQQMRTGLEQELGTASWRAMILSAEQFGASLHRPGELKRLRAFLASFGSEITVVAHLDAQARVLAAQYGAQVHDGRLAPLSRELDLARELAGEARQGWREAALRHWVRMAPQLNDFPEIQAPPFWLDYAQLLHSWEQVFGTGSVRLRPFDAAGFADQRVMAELTAAFDLPAALGRAPDAPAPAPPSAAWIARMRAMNQLFDTALKAGRIIPRQMWHRLLGHLEWPGPPIDPGSLAPVSGLFAADNADLAQAFPALAKGALAPPPAADPWQEAAPEAGFRATQYFTVFLPNIDKITREELQREKETPGASGAGTGASTVRPARPEALPPPSPDLPELVRETYVKLAGTRFAPHNRLGSVDETTPAPPYEPAAPRTLPEGSSGRVIVACMKNEGPYILEWIAYHRAIGVDGFIIYTNDCTDGTDRLLARLQETGIVEHRNNDVWKGNSPQQHALNQSLREPLVKNAEWIIHIDVDEFMNIRCGNGTLDDLFERIPGATNVAMTWRLFGNCGVDRFHDSPVIGQFERCAPSYCPKPHTVWGFKTMTKNIGAYPKLSCHRPNKLVPERQSEVLWVNGSGQPMGDAVKARGWRSDMRTIGYDLIQLNHYALRSADSFLVKRQRGRALHVDRSIGQNYWLRMDWSYHTDLTIQRNLPRLGDELERLLEDEALARLHDAAVRWHREKAEALRAEPEFADLLKAAQALKLTEMERVAHALALDMES